MDFWLIYKTGPFTVLALVLIGYALVEGLQTRWKDWDLFTITIIFGGLAGGVYIGSMAIGFAPFLPDPGERWFDMVRISLWLTVVGIPSIYINVWRAIRARMSGKYRKKVIYDVHDDETRNGQERTGLP